MGVKRSTGQEYTCDVGYERFLGPEIFFNPEIFSPDFTKPLPQVVDECIVKAPIDSRRGLYRNIVLSGGTTMFKNFARRLNRDINDIVDNRMEENGSKIRKDSRGDIFPNRCECNLTSFPTLCCLVWWIYDCKYPRFFPHVSY